MKRYFLHGMGGNKSDWKNVLKTCPGVALEITRTKNIEQTIEELVSKISPRSATICGYSMGARLAVLLCDLFLQNNTPPKNLVLLSSGMGFFDENQRKARIENDAHWAALARSNPSKFWENWYLQDIFSSFRALPQAIRTDWLNRRTSLNSSVLAQQLENLGPANHGYLPPMLDKFVNVGISVLYIVGELDKKYVSEAKGLEERGLAVRIIPGAGHILPLEAPEILAEIIRAY